MSVDTATRQRQVRIAGSRAYIYLAFTALFWGSAFVGSKVAVAAVPPAVAAFFRFGLGALIMLAIQSLRRRAASDALSSREVWRKHWGSIALLGLTGVAMYNLFFFAALKFAYASDGSMIIPTVTPVLTTVLAAWWQKERFGRAQIGGLAIAFCGALLFFSHLLSADGFDGSGRAMGGLFLVFSSLCWAYYTLLGARVLQEVDSLTLTGYAMMVGAAFLGIVAAPQMITLPWSELTLTFWLLQGYLALFPSVVGNWFYYRGVQAIGGARASMFMYLVPVFGVLLAVTLLGEELALVQVVGAFIIVIGVRVSARRPRR